MNRSRQAEGAGPLPPCLSARDGDDNAPVRRNVDSDEQRNVAVRAVILGQEIAVDHAVIDSSLQNEPDPAIVKILRQVVAYRYSIGGNVHGIGLIATDLLCDAVGGEQWPDSVRGVPR